MWEHGHLVIVFEFIEWFVPYLEGSFIGLGTRDGVCSIYIRIEGQETTITRIRWVIYSLPMWGTV